MFFGDLCSILQVFWPLCQKLNCIFDFILIGSVVLFYHYFTFFYLINRVANVTLTKQQLIFFQNFSSILRFGLKMFQRTKCQKRNWKDWLKQVLKRNRFEKTWKNGLQANYIVLHILKWLIYYGFKGFTKVILDLYFSYNT